MSTVNAITSAVTRAAQPGPHRLKFLTGTLAGLSSYGLSEKAAAVAELSQHVPTQTLKDTILNTADFLGLARVAGYSISDFASTGLGITAFENLVGAFTKSGRGPIAAAIKYISNTFSKNGAAQVAEKAFNSVG